MTPKSKKAIRKCAQMMQQLLALGFSKSHLPQLEKLFWKVRDWKTGKVKTLKTAKP